MAVMIIKSYSSDAQRAGQCVSVSVLEGVWGLKRVCEWAEALLLYRKSEGHCTQTVHMRSQ